MALPCLPWGPRPRAPRWGPGVLGALSWVANWRGAKDGSAGSAGLLGLGLGLDFVRFGLLSVGCWLVLGRLCLAFGSSWLIIAYYGLACFVPSVHHFGTF